MGTAPLKQEKIFETSNTSSKYYLTSAQISTLSASYAEATHLSSSHYFEDEANQALLYQLQLMEEDINELRRVSTGSGELSVNGGSF